MASTTPCDVIALGVGMAKVAAANAEPRTMLEKCIFVGELSLGKFGW